MTGADLEIYLGVVIDNNDPENQCRVKAVVPTVFDNSTMSAEDMLWIRPACMFGQQTFSKMKIGSKIWVIHDKNNYYDYSYIPQFELTANSQKYVNNNSDVSVSRDMGGNVVSQYYNDDDGFMTNIGDNKIQLDPDGNLAIKSGDYGINATDGQGLMIGSGAEGAADYEPAVLGDHLEDFFTTTSIFLGQLITAIQYSAPICIGLTPVIAEYKNSLDMILAKKEYLSKNIKIN